MIDWNSTDFIMLTGVIVTLLIGLFNFFGSLSRNKSIGMLEKGQFFESMNKSINLANERALKAETRNDALEKRIEELERILAELEDSLSYRITFEAILGSKPKIGNTKIEHVTKD